MSSNLNRAHSCAPVAPVIPNLRASTGVGMLELLVALLVFSVGMLGLISAQLVAKRAGFEAAQRSVATNLARDMLERMRANPVLIDAYRNAELGDEANRLPAPATHCDRANCSATQLAAFDLWQWEAWLLGQNEQGVDGGLAGLVAPRACITTDGGHAIVAISWQGSAEATQAPQSPCAAHGGVVPGDATRRRRELAIATFIAGV